MPNAGFPPSFPLPSSPFSLPSHLSSLPATSPSQAGPTAADEEIASWLRRHHSSIPVFLAVNKCESTTKGAMQAADFWGLG